MTEAAKPTWKRRACMWKVLAIIPLTITSAVCLYLIIQPDWYRYSDNITFGVIGGPFCDFNDTELIQRCHLQLKDFYRLDIGIATLVFLTIAPAAILFSVNLIIMSVWSGHQHLKASLIVQFFGVICVFIGNLLFMLHSSSDIIGFNKPNKTVFRKKDPSVGYHPPLYASLIVPILFAMSATLVSLYIQSEHEDEEKEVENQKRKDLEDQLKKKEEKKDDKDKKDDKKGDKKESDKEKKEDKKDEKKEEDKKTDPKPSPKIDPMKTIQEFPTGFMDTSKDPSRAYPQEGPKTQEAREYLAKKQKPPPLRRKRLP